MLLGQTLPDGLKFIATTKSLDKYVPSPNSDVCIVNNNLCNNLLLYMGSIWQGKILAKHVGKSYWRGKIWRTSNSQCIYVFRVSVNTGKENFGK